MASALPSRPFREIIAHRHSVYPLTSTLPASLTDAHLIAMITDTLSYVPSAFNIQSTRCVLLVGEEHKKFWTMASDVLGPKTPEDKKEHAQARIDGFRNAYGSVVFLEDEETLDKSREHNKALAHMFTEWSDHSSGMHQYVMWSALESYDGVGCNLQHYQFDDDVARRTVEMWDLPKQWKMRAQLVFGGIKEGAPWPQQKDKLPASKTLKVFGAKE